MFGKKYDEIPSDTTPKAKGPETPSAFESFLGLFKTATPTTTSSLPPAASPKTSEQNKPLSQPPAPSGLRKGGYGAC